MLMLQLWVFSVISNCRRVGRRYLMVMSWMMYIPMKRALVGTRPRDNKCASSQMTPRRIPLGVHSFSHIVDDHTAQLIRIRPELTKTAGWRSSCIRMTLPSFAAVIETSSALYRIPPERNAIPRGYCSRTLDPGAILTEVDARLCETAAIRCFSLK